VGISPTIDLERCVGTIERRVNIPYHFNFVRNLKARMRRKAVCWPDRYDVRPLGSVWTIRRFDALYTAPNHGYDSVEDYYYRASALRVVDRIPVPALMVVAADDPFVPVTPFESEAVRGNRNITVRIERHGGHCGFAAQPRGDDDGYWAERTAIEFLASVMPA
jgi:predicted alpha/beta-fold hydrolase